MQVDELDKNHRPEKIIVDTMKLKRSWNKSYIATAKRLNKYYSRKGKVIEMVSDKILSYNPENKSKENLEKELAKIRKKGTKVKIKSKDIEDSTMKCGLTEMKDIAITILKELEGIYKEK